jgi:hypothetical protein
MRTGAKRIRFCGTVSTRGEAAGKLTAAGDAMLIERGRPRLLLLSCPCGCGEEFPINLDPRAGPAWVLYGRSNALSLYPSVWRESGCRSHYVIWRGRILLFRRYDDDFDAVPEAEGEFPSVDAVLAHLPQGTEVPFADVASALSAVPWDVLRICRQLVRKGLAYEAAGDRRGAFGRTALAEAVRTESFMLYDGPIRIVRVVTPDGSPVEGVLELGPRRNPVRVEPGLVVPWAWALRLERQGARISFVELPKPQTPEFG